MGLIAKDVADADLAQLLTDLRDADACARALAALCVLLPRLPPEQLSAVEGELPTLVELLASDQPTVQVGVAAHGSAPMHGWLLLHGYLCSSEAPNHAGRMPCMQSNATAALTALASQDEDIAARVAQLAVSAYQPAG